MTLLTAAEIADLQEEQAGYFPDTCVIATPATVATSASGVTQGAATTATVSCRIAPSVMGGGGDETVYADRLAGRALLLITMPFGTAVKPVSTIYSPNVNGRAFEVISVAPPASLELARRVAVAEKT